MKNISLFNVASIEIEAATSSHPNEMKFSGVLVRIDEPSTKAPHGSDGHKILIPRALAEKQLHTLIGMPVNYHSNLDQHQPDRPVGVIQSAKIVGNDVVISGTIWKKSFPEAEKDLVSSKLGMSFEAAQISVQDTNADIWKLSSMCFTGATILYKDSAAYFHTSAKVMAAGHKFSSLRMISNITAKGATMDPKTGKKKIAAGSGKSQKTVQAASDQAALVAAIAAAMKPVAEAIKKNTAVVANLQASFEAHSAATSESDDDVEASEDDEDDLEASDDDEEEDDAVSAASPSKKKGKKADGDDATDSVDDDDEDEDDLESSIDDASDDDDLIDIDEGGDDVTPGKLGKKIVNKGRKVASAPAGKKMSHKPNVAAAGDPVYANLVRRQAKQIRQMRETIASQQEAISAAAERTERRSISASAVLTNTLAKGNLDVASLVRENQKVTVAELDQMSAAAGLSATQSIAQKNEAFRIGILEE